MKRKNTIFISDLHLETGNHQAASQLFKFIDETIENIGDTDAVYILGDLFMFWLGDDDCSAFSESVKSYLKKLSSKIPVYIIPGNHDFIMGERFEKETGCVLISDPYKIDLYGTPTLIAHGDLLCSEDIAHHVLHRIIRFPACIKFFLKFPISIRSLIAKSLQSVTNKFKVIKNKNKMNSKTETIKKLLTYHGARQIIYGHIHEENIIKLQLNNEYVNCVSLGRWNASCRSILVYYSDNFFEFKK